MRTDVHRPSVINPAEYEFVAFDYMRVDNLGDALVLKAQRERIAAHMAQTGGKYSTHEHGGNCMVCGNANAIYTVLFYHRPSNTYVRTGQDCADKMEMGYGDFSAFRRHIENHLEAIAGKKKAQAILAEAGLTRCWDIYTAEQRNDFQYEEVTITDIVGKLVRYGSISEKAQNYLSTLLGKIDNRAAIEAQRKAETEAAAPCPTGRVTITGTVLAVKAQESYYGVQVKMLVQATEGYKVWGTCVGGFEKGQKVRFAAAVEPSKDDPKFGYFKRPTKAEVLEDVVREEPCHPKATTPGDILADAVGYLYRAYGNEAIDAIQVLADAAPRI